MGRILGGLRGHGAESTQRYKMHEKLISIGDDYWIGNEAGKEKVAEVSKKWFRIRDTYGVEFSPRQDAALILAITVALDQVNYPSLKPSPNGSGF